MIKNGGCSYGKVTRQMMTDTRLDIKKLEESVSMITNHYSKRLPLWATVLGFVLCTAFGVMSTILATLLVK